MMISVIFNQILPTLLLICVMSFLTIFILYSAILAIYSFQRKKPIIDAPRETIIERRFAVLVPAHNEENTVSRCISSLNKQNYPSGLIDIIVIADNCTDRTAEVVREHNITCFERHEPRLRGKGQALNWALNLIQLDDFDAVVFIDADAVVDESFFLYMNTHLERGSLVIQSVNGRPGAHTRCLLCSRTRSGTRREFRIQSKGPIASHTSAGPCER